jgi:hypothetical protein
MDSIGCFMDYVSLPWYLIIVGLTMKRLILHELRLQECDWQSPISHFQYFVSNFRSTKHDFYYLYLFARVHIHLASRIMNDWQKEKQRSVTWRNIGKDQMQYNFSKWIEPIGDNKTIKSDGWKDTHQNGLLLLCAFENAAFGEVTDGRVSYTRVLLNLSKININATEWSENPMMLVFR